MADCTRPAYGFDPLGNTPDEFAAFIKKEMVKWAILDDLLNGFKGVLVSDFYAAYDSVPCPQQKCLIHLMRDINEDLNKNPFDEELKAIAGRFGALLREIVETVDQYGLKARHLGRQQTLHYRGREFLEFMRSGEMEIPR